MPKHLAEAGDGCKEWQRREAQDVDRWCHPELRAVGADGLEEEPRVLQAAGADGGEEMGEVGPSETREADANMGKRRKMLEQEPTTTGRAPPQAWGDAPALGEQLSLLPPQQSTTLWPASDNRIRKQCSRRSHTGSLTKLRGAPATNHW